MKAVQLDADILRNLGIIAEDESMLDKVAKYLRRVVKQMTDDPTRMSKEEYFEMLDKSKRQVAEGKCTSFTNVAEMNAWLNAL